MKPRQRPLPLVIWGALLDIDAERTVLIDTRLTKNLTQEI
jgi:hypothetical protein